MYHPLPPHYPIVFSINHQDSQPSKYNFLFYLMNNVDQYLVMLEKLQIIPEREVKGICDKVTPH
jgi:hypothetical protein